MLRLYLVFFNQLLGGLFAMPFISWLHFSYLFQTLSSFPNLDACAFVHLDALQRAYSVFTIALMASFACSSSFSIISSYLLSKKELIS